MSKIEKRYVCSPEFIKNNQEFRTQIVRASGDTGQNSRKILGYGAVFNQKSKIITEWISDKREYRTFFEVLEPQCFDKLIANNWNNFDVVLNVNHHSNKILARLASGTLIISKDDKGLIYETELPITERGEDVLQMVARGDYYQSSFQFTIAEGGERWELDQSTGLYTRYITEVEMLIDMCVATWFGAYENTDIQVVRNEFNIYNEQDIAVAKQRLNQLLSTASSTTDEIDYRIELERDVDRIKMLG